MKNNTLFAQYFNANPMWKTINFDVFHCGFVVWVGPDDLELMETKLKEYIDDKVANGAAYRKDVCKDFAEAMTGYKNVGSLGMVIWRGKRYDENRTHFMFIITKGVNGGLPYDNELLASITHESDHVADYVVARCHLNPTAVVPSEVHAYLSEHAVRKLTGFFDWEAIIGFLKAKFKSEKENPNGGEPSGTTGADNTSEKGENNERTT